ncbi:MAG: branched-chain amino acid ABC transporter substrate-binding protein [Alphaproteobacteria bacterium]|nr:branched-chain amino acid ABC transporter substrate-binding protein [Alphaproteobacteria bacterium]
MRSTALKFALVASALGLAAFAAPAQAQIKFGVMGPITGPNAAFGAQLKNGVEQAVADINAAGGILGQRIELQIGDDASKPEQGVSVANKFVGDGVKFVIGAFNSGVSIPSSETLHENGILQITPASTNPRYTERKLWNTFRVCGRDDQQGGAAARIIGQLYKGKRIAIVHDKTTYGKGLADEVRAALRKQGIREVLYDGINIGEKDFSALVSRLKQANTDLLFWGGLHTEGGLIARQMREQGVNAPLMGGDGITDDEFAAIAGPAAEGTLMTFSPDPRTNPANKAIVDRFRTGRKFEPQAYTLYSYAAVQIIKQAAEAAKSLDPRKVAEVMHSGMKFQTVLGEISFDKKGDVSNDGYFVNGKQKDRYVLYRWRKADGGKITYFEAE